MAFRYLWRILTVFLNDGLNRVLLLATCLLHSRLPSCFLFLITASQIVPDYCDGRSGENYKYEDGNEPEYYQCSIRYVWVFILVQPSIF